METSAISKHTSRAAAAAAAAAAADISASCYRLRLDLLLPRARYSRLPIVGCRCPCWLLLARAGLAAFCCLLLPVLGVLVPVVPLAAALSVYSTCCRWLLLAAVGCGWPLLAAVGCCWLLLAAVGCCWLLLAAAAEFRTTTVHHPRTYLLRVATVAREKRRV